jgi:hypothetical protein
MDLGRWAIKGKEKDLTQVTEDTEKSEEKLPV